MDLVVVGAGAALPGLTCDIVLGMKWFWWNASRGDVIGVLLVIAVVGVLVFALIRVPGRPDSHPGFGPDWECTSHPLGDPTCIKKLGK